MTGVISTGSVPKLLWPGLNKVWGDEYDQHAQEWRFMVDTLTSDKSYEEDVLMPGFGLAPVQPQGAGVVYDSTQQGYVSRYTNVAYGLGFIVTREAIDDNQYERKALGSAKKLARSLLQTKENVVANIYNRAFNGSYLGGDGKSLLATDHPTQAGTFSNLIAADLSEAALEDLIVLLMGAFDDRGLKVNLMPKSLIVPPAQVFDATRILKSQLQNDTANNATNAMRTLGLFPEGVKVNHYLTDPDAYFIRTNVDSGLQLFQRTSPEFTQDNDFDTSNLKYKAYERYVAGWTDPRALWGSQGV